MRRRVRSAQIKRHGASSRNEKDIRGTILRKEINHNQLNHQKIKQLGPIFSLLHINQLVLLVPTQIMSNTMFLKLLISNHIVDMLQTMAILICAYETISMWMTIKINFF